MNPTPIPQNFLIGGAFTEVSFGTNPGGSPADNTSGGNSVAQPDDGFFDDFFDIYFG